MIFVTEYAYNCADRCVRGYTIVLYLGYKTEKKC